MHIWFSSQAGDYNTSVLSQHVILGYDMAEMDTINKMNNARTAFDQSRATMIKASSNMSQAKATAKVNISQQKANRMLGEIKKATG